MPSDEPESAAPRPIPTLRGQQTFLRPAERADLEDFVRWFSDAETTQYLALRAPFSMALEEQWFTGMLEKQGKTDWHFVICLIEDGRAIGTAGLHQVDNENGSAAFGISIGDKSMWNQGHGTDALRTICDFGFGQLRFERIWLEVYEPNLRAQRSYEKAGFVKEGTLRHALFRDGAHRDVLLYALLREEWAAQSRAKTWEIPPA
jgi:RimJ/RimL family protein N-acetyltransferase